MRLNEGISFKPPDYSDAGNANRLSVEYHGLLAFTDSLGWLWWNGKKWERNEHKATDKAVTLTENMTMEALAELSAATYAEADAKLAVAQKEDGAKERLEAAQKAVKAAKGYYAHALKSRNAPRIRGMLDLAKPSFLIKASMLDADPFLLNTPGGIVNLETGKVLPHDIDAPFKWCSQITAVAPGSKGAEMWIEFLDTVTCGDRSLAGFLQMVAGMAAIGKVYHEGIFAANGSGRNGKSTLFNAVAGVFGDYAGTIDVRTLTTDRQNKGASLATLRGKRLVIASELEEHQRLSTSTLKQLASTDKLTIEEKFKAPETVDQTHTLVLYTNHLPRVGSTDNGTWRRLLVVPFNAVIPQGSGTQNYADKLVKEAGPAIMSWIIQGAMNFIKNDFKLIIPDCVEEATEEYRERENWLENFINERCVREPDARTGSRDLYLEYKDWAQENGEFVRRENDFAGAMEAAGYHKITPKGKKFWVGLRLVAAEYINNPMRKARF